jgi:hypothetical protein
MFRRCNNLKFATALVVLAAISSAGFAPALQARAFFERENPAACARAASCCCGCSCAPSSGDRGCCCRQKEPPSQLPPAVPNHAGKTIELTLWMEAWPGDPVIATSGQSNPSPPRSFYTPLQRSMQSLICVWRT